MAKLSDIPYLEAALESARAMQRKIDLRRGGFDERRRYQNLAEHIDALLDKLAPLYLLRHYEHACDCATNEDEHDVGPQPTDEPEIPQP